MTISRDAGQELRRAIALDLRGAQRRRDHAMMQLYRTLLAAVDNAGAVDAPQRVDYSNPGLGQTEIPRRRLDADAARRVLLGEIDARRDAARTYRAAREDQRAATLDAEREVIGRYLELLE